VTKRIRKIQEKQGGKKEEVVYVSGGFQTCVFSIGSEHPQATARDDPPSGASTRMGTSPTT
jgi:hypothetical protein